jgi:PH (Pleckstrin Homology) domain-containing protein
MSASRVDGAQDIVIQKLDVDDSRLLLIVVMVILLTPVLAVGSVGFLVALFLGNGQWWFPVASLAVGGASFFCGRTAFRFLTMRVTMDQSGLRFRNPISTQVLPWAGLSSFDVVPVDLRPALRGVCAVLTDGTRVPIGCLAWVYPDTADDYAARLQELVDARRNR